MKGSLIICIIYLLLSCSNNKQHKIGFMLPNLVVSRYVIDRDNFISKARELGVEVLVADAQDNDSKQINQAAELIDQGANVLVLMPVNINSSAAIVRYAHKMNVKVIGYCRLIANSDLDYFIGFNAQLIGKQMADYIIKRKPEGNYIIFNGDKTDNNAVLTSKGQMDILDPYIKSGKIKIIYSAFLENWSPDEAYFLMKKICDLSGERIDVVLSGNDGMASGVIKGLDEYGILDKVLVTGSDAELQACKQVVRSRQVMTIYMPIKKLAMFTAEMAVNVLNNKNLETQTTTFNGLVNVPTIIYETIPIDILNMKSTIIADGFYKEADVYSQK